MANPWNFERRTVVCARFLVGVSLAVTADAHGRTTLEGVRNRVRLPPEDALFAARRLDQEQLIVFDPGGSVHATAAGITRADDIVRTATSRTHDADEITRTVREGGVALEMLKLALLVHGGALVCGEGLHRVVLTGDQVTLEPA